MNIANWPGDLDLRDVASPGLLVDADRVVGNIQSMLATVNGDPARLRPHVKTHKMSSVIHLQRAAGIDQFKAATIAEARMVAQSHARSVLIAYQMVGPNLKRLAELVEEFPDTEFISLVDHPDAAIALSDCFSMRALPIAVMIDVDCGMHRTGVEFGPSLRPLRHQIESSKALRYAGLHVYDGHLHDPSLPHRESQVESILAAVQQYDEWHPSPRIVVGGSPTFDLWAHKSHWQCSPGTPVFWDTGYATKYPELNFSVAISLVTRVISKPGLNRLCLDLGYKAVAAEMPLELRVTLPMIPDAVLMGHSEEHLVIETSLADELPLGQALLAFPRHVCPTVALHDFATVVRSGRVTTERWTVDARGR